MLQGVTMHIKFTSMTSILAASFALMMTFELHGRPSWAKVGYNSVSTENDLWYLPPEKTPPVIQRNDCYSWRDIGFSVAAGADHFRGIPDGERPDNNGVTIALEAATPIPFLKKYGIGFQIGGSYGAYDFAGRDIRPQKEIQSQGFLTTGLFIRPHPVFPLSCAVVYDWMFNKNFGLHSESPTLEQVRGQVSYYVTPCDEIGVWATYDTKKTRVTEKHATWTFHVIYRPIAQANFFWRHVFGKGVQTTLWAGTPIRNRLYRKDSDRPGKYIVGFEIGVPFYENWALIARAAYMQPGSKRGVLGNKESTNNIAFNVVYYFGGNPSSCESRGNTAWLPYLPLANNSNFFVDENTAISTPKKMNTFEF